MDGEMEFEIPIIRQYGFRYAQLLSESFLIKNWKKLLIDKKGRTVPVCYRRIAISIFELNFQILELFIKFEFAYLEQSHQSNCNGSHVSII